MNVLKLADSRKEWANDLLSLNEWSIDAETMLRKLEGQLAFRIDAVKSYQQKVDEQQAEIETLKSAISEALNSIPAVSDVGVFYFEHHDMNGEYLGYEQVDPNYVIRRMEAILREASEK